jgi:CheY-like chemotaxis protein
VLAQLRGIGEAFDIIRSVEDGTRAVDAVLKLDPDATVLDIAMLLIDGLDVAASLRGDRTKTVILTTYEDRDHGTRRSSGS